jgi:hypothetical protein
MINTFPKTHYETIYVKTFTSSYTSMLECWWRIIAYRAVGWMHVSNMVFH